MKQSDTKVLPKDIKKYLDDGYKLIDIREEAEMEDIPKLPEALSIPISSLLEDPRQYLTDLNEKILLVCRTGKRSKVLKNKMYSLGYTNVLDVCDGMHGVVEEQESEKEDK